MKNIYVSLTHNIEKGIIPTCILTKIKNILVQINQIKEMDSE
jgi:hypothetical protein